MIIKLIVQDNCVYIIMISKCSLTEANNVWHWVESVPIVGRTGVYEAVDGDIEEVSKVLDLDIRFCITS